MDTPPSSNLRPRTRVGDPKPVRASPRTPAPATTEAPPTEPPTATATTIAPSPAMRRNPPYLPTPFETFLVALFPTLLLFGTLFSLLSPQTRSAEYNVFTQAHSQDASLAPSYFARKNNIFNTLFVKRGWFWTTVTYFFFLFTHPATTTQVARLQGAVRWGLTTAWWFLVTQWCFGPAIIDRGFRWTGGRCELIEEKVELGEGDAKEVFTAVACKAAGGAWRGGHDISGHVFLLVLASGFLVQEVGWVVLRYAGLRSEERSIVMTDGATKSAAVEAQVEGGAGEGKESFGVGGKVALGVVGLSCWMLLMTAIYFHTWFEKLTGLLTALIALYGLYVVPRFVPAVRQVVGLPGI